MTRTPAAILRTSVAVLAVLSAAALAAHKIDGRLGGPGLVASLLGGLGAVALANSARAAVVAIRGRSGRARALAEAAAGAGLLVGLTAGLANWALGVQGVIVLMEREPVAIASPGEAVLLELGPLADARERETTVVLARLSLESVGDGNFRVVSRLQTRDGRGSEHVASVASDRSARAGALIFHQGAFGFAPRIVATKQGRTLLDAHVPFRTVRQDSSGLAFVEEFGIAAEGLRLHGAITLEDLNDDMKGHPRLELEVDRNGSPLGVGALRPGEFVDLEGDVRVGFAGLRRWSEIAFSRRNYGHLVIGGAIVWVCGLVTWAVLAWRGR